MDIQKGAVDVATTDAQKRATVKYMKENLEEIRLRVIKGQKSAIKAHAEKQGKSLQRYIIDLIAADMGKKDR